MPNYEFTLARMIADPYWIHDPTVLIDEINDLHWYHETVGEPALKAVYEGCELSELPEAVELSIQAAAHVNTAWSWRSNGWASSVSEEGWEGFRKHLDLAAERLEASWALDPTLPLLQKLAVSCRMLLDKKRPRWNGLNEV